MCPLPLSPILIFFMPRSSSKGGSVHVRNTSRVTSPTPRGDQKQNWRVRSLISSPRERTSPGRRCGAALSRSGATTGGCRAGRGSGARSRARAFAAEKRTSRTTRGAAESRAAGVSTAARTVEGGEARFQAVGVLRSRVNEWLLRLEGG